MKAIAITVTAAIACARCGPSDAAKPDAELRLQFAGWGRVSRLRRGFEDQLSSLEYGKRGESFSAGDIATLQKQWTALVDAIDAAPAL